MGKTGHLISRVYNQYKRDAGKRGYRFDLTRDQVLTLIKQDCYICGAEPCNRKVSKMGAILWYNGIDRVDSALGYVAGNVKPCCWKCNKVKAQMEIGELRVHLRRMLRGLKGVA